MEERSEKKPRPRKNKRQCLSMDETILEKLHEKLTQNRSKVSSINKSMNSLPSVSNQELLNFLCHQNVKAQTSELCKIAREINLSQLEDFSLNPAEKLRVIEGPKYHSWPKHSRQIDKHKVIRYHNYGLKEEQEPDFSYNEKSCEDLLDHGKSGFNTERSWTSPSELNVVEEECIKELSKSLNEKLSISCPCLASSIDSVEESDLKSCVKSYLSLRNLTKSGESLENITENIEGIINNDFKKKFKSSRTSDNRPDTNTSSEEFDKAYNSVFKHNNILDLIQDNCENLNTTVIKSSPNEKSTKYQHISSSSSPLFSSAKRGHLLIRDNDRTESSCIYNDDSSDSDSGVGQFQDLLPHLRFENNDAGVQPHIFKEKADVSL